MVAPEGSGSVLGRRGIAGLFWLALIAALAAAFTLAGGSAAFELGPLHVSIRSPRNPLVGAVVFAALGLWLVGPTAFIAEGRRLDGVLLRWSWALALTIAAVVLWSSVVRGSFVAGSADASGYLNESRLWRQGALEIEPRSAMPLQFETGSWPLAPLGFRPSPSGNTLVPTYPPGLPLAMAAFNRVAGEGAEFLVVPVAASLLVFFTFLLGRQLGGPVAGLLASAMTAASPTVLFQSLQPMSDVPAACALTLAFVLLARPSPGAAAAAGAAAVAACLIRPNLFAMVPLLGLAAWWWEPNRRRGLVRAATFVMPPVLVALAFAAWQRQLYGGATETGYGAVETLFALQNVGLNLVRYPVWLFDVHGFGVLLAFAGPVLLARGTANPTLERARAVRVAWSALALFGALLGFYLLYPPFDTWAFLRFLVPALPALFALLGVAVVGLTSRLPAPGRAIVCALVLTGMPAWELARARERGVFSVQQIEHRYEQVADFANARPEPNVFVTLQHSGSLAYYSARPILRWDWMSPSEIDRAMEELQSNRIAVYVILDDWEEARFRERFAGTALLARMAAPVFTVRIDDVTRTSVYLLGPRAAPPAIGS